MTYFGKIFDHVGRLFLQYGFGGPGKTAKTLVKLYVKMKRNIPNKPQEYYLSCLLIDRVETSIRLGFQDEMANMSEWHIKDIVKDCLANESPLSCLCTHIIKIERKDIIENMLEAGQNAVYYMTLDIIKEVVEKYAPGE